MTEFVTIPKHLTYETIEGETIVIDLKKGHYYSLNRTASFIWNQLNGPIAINAFTGEMRAFIEALLKEGLLLKRDGEGITITLPKDQAPPAFEKFEDMEDLLLLDPIHDTDDAGWPHQLPKETVRK